MDRHHRHRAALTQAILADDGATSVAARRAAHDGGGAAGPVASYVATVTAHAYRVTDDQVAALRAAGQDDPQIFELTVAAAVGQATRQLDAALAALATAVADPTGAA